MKLPDTHLTLFLTRATPLRAWYESGILEREIALYTHLRPHLQGISIVTSGGPDELDYQADLGDIEILYNSRGLPPNVYSLLAPLLHRSALQHSTIYKTNQLDGAWTALLAGALYRRPVIVRAGYLWAELLDAVDFSYRKVQFARRLQRFALRRADRVLITSAEMKQEIITTAGVPHEQITVIPNYVDTEAFHPDPDIARIPGRICFVGRLARQKNLPMLLQATTQIPHTSLVIIGDGPERESLAALAAELDIQVDFKGRMPNHAISAEINASEIFVLPSHYEGHPKALIEAMACGAAVIGTAVEGIQNLIEHKRTGLLCAPTAAELSTAIRRLLSDAALREVIGTNARNFAVTSYALPSIIQQELAVYRTLLQRDHAAM